MGWLRSLFDPLWWSVVRHVGWKSLRLNLWKPRGWALVIGDIDREWSQRRIEISAGGVRAKTERPRLTRHYRDELRKLADALTQVDLRHIICPSVEDRTHIVRVPPVTLFGVPESLEDAPFWSAASNETRLFHAANVRYADLMHVRPFAMVQRMYCGASIMKDDGWILDIEARFAEDEATRARAELELERRRVSMKSRRDDNGWCVRSLTPLVPTPELIAQFGSRHTYIARLVILILSDDGRHEGFTHLIGTNDGFSWTIGKNGRDHLSGLDLWMWVAWLVSYSVSSQAEWHIDLRASKDHLAVSFGMDNGAMLEWFKDRAKQVGEARRSPLAHIVDVHTRKSAVVRAHYRGTREFVWAGLMGRVRSPDYDDRFIKAGVTPKRESFENVLNALVPESDRSERKKYLMSHAVPMMKKLVALERIAENKEICRRFQRTRYRAFQGRRG